MHMSTNSKSEYISSIRSAAARKRWGYCARSSWVQVRLSFLTRNQLRYLALENHFPGRSIDSFVRYLISFYERSVDKQKKI